MGNAVKAITKYTYADYLTWNDDDRWEIIEGVPFNMSPAPRRIHQKISRKLTRIIDTFLIGKKGELYAAPFDVRLGESFNEEVLVETIVQPDLLVYCDEKKLDDKGGKGAPDFIIEILSPWNADKDLKIKSILYQKHGIKEYWIIDPDKNITSVTLLGKDNRYDKWIEYDAKSKIKCTVLKGLIIDSKEIFS